MSTGPLPWPVVFAVEPASGRQIAAGASTVAADTSRVANLRFIRSVSSSRAKRKLASARGACKFARACARHGGASAGRADLRERPRHGHPLWLYGVTSAQDVAVGHEPTSMLGQLMSVMQVVPGALRQRRSGGARAPGP